MDLIRVRKDIDVIPSSELTVSINKQDSHVPGV